MLYDYCNEIHTVAPVGLKRRSGEFTVYQESSGVDTIGSNGLLGDRPRVRPYDAGGRVVDIVVCIGRSLGAPRVAIR